MKTNVLQQTKPASPYIPTAKAEGLTANSVKFICSYGVPSPLPKMREAEDKFGADHLNVFKREQMLKEKDFNFTQ